MAHSTAVRHYKFKLVMAHRGGVRHQYVFFCKTTNGAPPGGEPLVTWITNGAFVVGAPLVSGQQQDFWTASPPTLTFSPLHSLHRLLLVSGASSVGACMSCTCK